MFNSSSRTRNRRMTTLKDKLRILRSAVDNHKFSGKAGKDYDQVW